MTHIHVTAQFFLNGQEVLTVRSLPFPIFLQCGMAYWFPTLDSQIRIQFLVTSIHVAPKTDFEISTEHLSSSIKVQLNADVEDAHLVSQQIQESLKLANREYAKFTG